MILIPIEILSIEYKVKGHHLVLRSPIPAIIVTHTIFGLTLPADNEILRFNAQSKIFTKYPLPTSNAGPLGIAR